MEVIVFSHTHWDREWYRPYQDFRIRLCDVIELIIKELQSNKMDCFYLDGQTVVLEDYLEIYPDKKPQIQELIENKKLFIGPWYVLADEFLVSGESLIRNLLTGIKQAKSIGCSDFFGYLPDSFGHNSEMPKILSSFNIKRAVLWRGAGDKKSEFRWESDDGSSIITTYLTEGYFQDVLHSETTLKDKSQKIKKVLDLIKKRTVSEKLLLPIGGDHLGPVFNLKQTLSELNMHIQEYELKQDKIQQYFSGIKLPESGLEVVKGELRDNDRSPVLPGVLSSRLYLKQLNAGSTWLLSKITEPLQVFLNNMGIDKNRRNELDYAWKLLLKNHPHDSICGCSVDEVHEENKLKFIQVSQICNSIISSCMNQLSGMIPKNSIIACNLSNYDFTGLIKIKTCDKIPEDLPSQLVGSTADFPEEILVNTQKAPFSEDMREIREYLVFAENIPAYSIKTLFSANCQDKVEVYPDSIKNSFIEIKINPDGSINFTDLKTGKCFENLHTVTKRTDVGDSYNYAPIEDEKPIRAKFINTEILEKGPLRGVLKINYQLETLISTKIIINAASKRSEFITSWENYTENHLMQIKFNLPKKIYKTVTENTFGLAEREFDPDYCIEDHITAEKGKELKTNSAPMQRFIFAQGLGILTEGLPEYVVSKKTLAITILRATGNLSATSLNTRNFPAGPPLKTPGNQCKGKNTVRYAIYAGKKPKELFKQADEFMGNIFARQGRSIDKNAGFFNKNLIKISNSNMLIYAVKAPESIEINGVVLRVFNVSENPEETFLNSEISFKGFMEVNSLEEQVSEKYNMDKKIKFKPKELKSLLIFK